MTLKYKIESSRDGLIVYVHDDMTKRLSMYFLDIEEKTSSVGSWNTKGYSNSLEEALETYKWGVGTMATPEWIKERMSLIELGQ